MSIFNQFPWVNYREYNLDWVIRTVKKALEDVSDAVSTYFADHIDTTLSVSGAAADAATVGSRLTTINGSLTSLGNRVTTLENNAVHYYRFSINNIPVPGVLRLSPNGSMTEAETAAALKDDINDNKPYVVMFDSLPADTVAVDTNDSNVILITSTFYSGRYDTSTHSGTFSTRIDVAAAPVVIDDTVSPAVYAVGDFATLKTKALAYNMSAVMIQGSSQIYTVEFWHYDSGEDKVVLFGDNAPHLQYQCKADGTISAL